MVKLLDRVKQAVSGTASSTTLGAAVEGFRTFNTAGAATNDVCRYAIEDDNGAFEIGTIKITGATTGTRTVELSSNSNNALTLTGNAVIFATLSAADLSGNAAPIWTTTPPSTISLATDGSTAVTLAGVAIDEFPVRYSWDGYSGTTLYDADTLPPQLASAPTFSGGTASLIGSSTSSNAGSFNFRLKASDGVRTATKSVLCNLSFFPPGQSDVLGFYDVGDNNSYSGSGTTWSDIGSNSGPDLTLSSSVSYNSSGIGSVPSLSVSNSGAVAYSGTAFSTSGNSTATIVAILQTNFPATPTHFQYFQNLTSPAQQGLNAHQTQSFLALYSSGSGNLTSQTGSAADSLYIDGVAKQNLSRSSLADLLFDSATVRAQMHSIVVQTCNLDAGFSLGTDSDDGRAINGQVRALIIYNRKITQTEIDAIHDYYKDVYTSNTHMPA